MSLSKQPDPVVRVYRIKWWLQAFAVLWTVLSSLIWGRILWNEVLDTDEPLLWHFIVGPLLTMGGSFWVVHLFRAKVTLFNDSIETCGPLGKATLRFDEIRGRREYAVTGGYEGGGDTHYLKVEPNDDRLPTLDFIRDYDFDSTFYAWFDALPDLNAADKQKRKASD